MEIGSGEDAALSTFSMLQSSDASVSANKSLLMDYIRRAKRSPSRTRKVQTMTAMPKIVSSVKALMIVLLCGFCNETTAKVKLVIFLLAEYGSEKDLSAYINGPCVRLLLSAPLEACKHPTKRWFVDLVVLRILRQRERQTDAIS